jgi:hypothetical protein
VKLQQAYFSENNEIGGWNMVGYIPPSDGETQNFFYGTGIALSGSASQNAQNVVGWAADNKVTLNNCQKGTNVTQAKQATASTAAHWHVLVSVNTTSNADVTFQSVVANTANTAECLSLTPSFTAIK